MTSAHLVRSGSHVTTPADVKTTSNCPASFWGRSYTFEQTNSAGISNSAASARASSIDLSEKSAPVTVAPKRAHDSVSMPKWHCRWRSLLPETSPTSSISKGFTVHRPRLNPSTS